MNCFEVVTLGKCKIYLLIGKGRVEILPFLVLIEQFLDQIG